MKKKIEFDSRYREAIESGKYKVKTLDGDDVRIVCWDADETPHPIIGLVTLEGDTGVTAIKYNGNGEPGPQWNRNLLAIIIETDEEELTDFEKGVVDMLWEVDHDYDVEAREGYYEEMVRKYGEKLKELAYKEICQNANKNEFPGKVIYDKGFEAGRKITEDQRNEIWESGNDFGYDEGKKDALLELPKWIWEPRMDSNGDYVDFVLRDELSTHTGAFLTKRAAKKYIEKYKYNHSNPRTYAMCAFRNFELEKLLNILRNIEL